MVCLRAILSRQSVLLLQEIELRSSTRNRSLGSKGLCQLNHLSTPSPESEHPWVPGIVLLQTFGAALTPFPEVLRPIWKHQARFCLFSIAGYPCSPCGKLSASKALQLCHRPLSLGEGSCFDLKCGVWLSKDSGFVDRHLPQSPAEVKKEALPAGVEVEIH